MVISSATLTVSTAKSGSTYTYPSGDYKSVYVDISNQSANTAGILTSEKIIKISGAKSGDSFIVDPSVNVQMVYDITKNITLIVLKDSSAFYIYATLEVPGNIYGASTTPDGTLNNGDQTSSVSATNQIISSGNSTQYNVCFLAGGLIKTPAGVTAVEELAVGDEVVAYVDGAETGRRVTWAGQAHCTVRPDLPLDEAGYPVRILKGAIAEGVPFQDLLITAEHCLLLDGQFVPARMLVNGRSIFYDMSITSYDYYHIETEDHSVIMANGMLTESYLDTGNRRSFVQKGAIVALGGRRNLSWEDDAAAPLTVAREIVEPLFRQIEARADQMGCAVQADDQPLTHERDLCLRTDTGAVLRQSRENNGWVMFMVPAGVESVRIVSNASRPCDVAGPFVDDRRTLGVLVGEVRIFEGNTTTTLTDHLRDADLAGWNNVEGGTMRWTAGDACLNLGQRPAGGIALLAMQIHAAGPYRLADTSTELSARHA